MAERLFGTKGLEKSKWDKSWLAPTGKKAGKAGKAPKKDAATHRRDAAAMEARIYFYSGRLSAVQELTRENVERKQVAALSI